MVLILNIIESFIKIFNNSKNEKGLRKMLSSRAITKMQAIAIIAVVIIAAIVGSLAYYISAPPPPPKKEEIVIGCSIGLTGRYAETGRFCLNGIMLWSEWINAQGGIYVKEYGRKLPVRIIYYDDKSEKETAVKLYEKLCTEDKVDFTLGPYASDMVFAASPISDKYKRICISYMGASESIFERGLKYVIGVLTPASLYFDTTLRMAATLDPKPRTVAILHTTELFSITAAKGAEKIAKELGFEVVYMEGYEKDAKDLTPLLSKAKALKAEILLGATYFPDSVLMVRQCKEIDYNPKIYSLLIGPLLKDFYDVLGKDAEYVFGSSEWEVGAGYKPDFGPTPKEFAEMHVKRYGYIPSYHAAAAFAGCLILQKGIEEAGSLDNDKVRETLGKLKFTTLFGPWQIDPKTGLQIAHRNVLTQWQKGKLVVVYPYEIAEAKLLYPTPTWAERAK